MRASTSSSRSGAREGHEKRTLYHNGFAAYGDVFLGKDLSPRNAARTKEVQGLDGTDSSEGAPGFASQGAFVSPQRRQEVEGSLGLGKTENRANSRVQVPFGSLQPDRGGEDEICTLGCTRESLGRAYRAELG